MFGSSWPGAVAKPVVLVRFMSQQMTRKTERRAEDMYDEFSSDRKDKDRYPI